MASVAKAAVAAVVALAAAAATAPSQDRLVAQNLLNRMGDAARSMANHAPQMAPSPKQAQIEFDALMAQS